MTTGFLSLTAVTCSAALFQFEYGIKGIAGDVQGQTFLSTSRPTSVPLSINDGQTLTVNDAQTYQFTNLTSFGNASGSNSVNRNFEINGQSRAQSVSVSIVFQPGSINIGQSAFSTWELDFSGDRKQLTAGTLAASGSGSHSGNLAARFSLSEINDDPISLIETTPMNLFPSLGLSLDGSSSSDRDSTGSIVQYEWDLDYDGTTFDSDLTGAQRSLTSEEITARYQDQTEYTVALRVTDNSGSQTISSSSFTVTSVPEPSSASLLALGSLTLLLRRRR